MAEKVFDEIRTVASATVAPSETVPATDPPALRVSAVVFDPADTTTVCSTASARPDAATPTV